jgi:hypothetical protein
MFESAVVRQAWRLRDVKETDVTQLRELVPADLEAEQEPPRGGSLALDAKATTAEPTREPNGTDDPGPDDQATDEHPASSR